MSVLLSKQPDDLWMSSIDANVQEENILCGISSAKLY